MLSIDAGFRRGLGLMVFGLWMSLVGMAFVLGLGSFGLILGLIVVLAGGVFVAFGSNVMTRTASRPR